MKKAKPLFPPPSGKNWSKRLPMEKRRAIVLKNKKGDYLKAAQAMDYLAKGTMDKKTRELSSADREYFRRMWAKGK
jgi:hypothetical protein